MKKENKTISHSHSQKNMCDIKEDFHLVLSGSVGESQGEFTTKLMTKVNLTPGYSFECALTKIIYPNTLANCYDGHISYYSYTLQKHEYVRIPSNYYALPKDFIEAWKSILQKDFQYYELATTDTNPNRFSLLLRSDGSGKEPTIELSKNLSVLTGLPQKISKEGHMVSEKNWDNLGGCGILFIYSNITENILMKTTSAPLLHVVKFDHDENKSYLEYEPSHRIYVPLQRRFLNEVTIALKNNINHPFPFLSGEVVIVMHIRPNSTLML